MTEATYIPPLRERALAFISSNPGLTGREIAKESGLDKRSVPPVLSTMFRDGVLDREEGEDGVFVYWKKIRGQL